MGIAQGSVEKELSVSRTGYQESKSRERTLLCLAKTLEQGSQSKSRRWRSQQ